MRVFCFYDPDLEAVGHGHADSEREITAKINRCDPADVTLCALHPEYLDYFLDGMPHEEIYEMVQRQIPHPKHKRAT